MYMPCVNSITKEPKNQQKVLYCLCLSIQKQKVCGLEKATHVCPSIMYIHVGWI